MRKPNRRNSRHNNKTQISWEKVADWLMLQAQPAVNQVAEEETNNLPKKNHINMM